jgi:hypothetical protein
MSNHIAVIDIDSVAYAIGNPNKVLDEQGNPVKILSRAGNMVFQYTEKTGEELKQSADWLMKNILTKCGCDSYIGWMKGNNTTQFRLQANPEYKQDRSKTPPIWWGFVQNYLFTYWSCKYINDIETDDAVVITANKLLNSFIVAIDSDVLSTPGTHFNWKTNNWITTTEEESSLLFWKSMITGTHNNTKGIPKKGEKYAEKLFGKWEQYGDPLHTIVFEEYINYFGEYQGIKEFYSNYVCNKLLTEKEGFVIPKPIEFKRKEINLI